LYNTVTPKSDTPVANVKTCEDWTEAIKKRRCVDVVTRTCVDATNPPILHALLEKGILGAPSGA